MYRIDHVYRILDRGFREDAVAEVEDMAAGTISIVEDILNTLFDMVVRREEDARVEVALDRDLFPDRLHCLMHVHPPVDADNICPAFFDYLENAGAVVGKIDDRDIEFLQGLDGRLYIGEDHIFIVIWRKDAGP